ncbi:MAG: hypothetical protein JO080_16495, partial [Mucilaginibacter sp.]|nr:hypothetical protein [Mucilaginibacter sp.]
GSRKSEVGSRKSEVGSRKSEVGSRKSEVGSRKSEVDESLTNQYTKQYNNSTIDQSNNKSEIEIPKFEIKNIPHSAFRTPQFTIDQWLMTNDKKTPHVLPAGFCAVLSIMSAPG